MTKVIALFNHKGGVSKTTTTFHLGHMLTKLGQKVLIVDSDPQCNLTGLVLGMDKQEGISAFYKNKNKHNIYKSLAPVFNFDSVKGGSEQIIIGEPTPTNNANLFMLAGHGKFSKCELQLGTAFLSSDSVPRLKPLISCINNLIRGLADKNSFDVVLVDMSPNISATNMCILMSSDFFIVPTSPDFFCYQSIESLSTVLPTWSNDLNKFKDGNILPEINPQMLGIISQNYRVYDRENKDTPKKSMTQAFKRWADKIEDITEEKLIPALKKEDMIIDKDIFNNSVGGDKAYSLAHIQNFNSLLPESQRLSKPMFDLGKKDGVWRGAVWLNAKQNIEIANNIYKTMAMAVANMVGLEIKKP